MTRVRESIKADPTLLRASHTGELPIGETILKCAVLEDGTRVLTRATFVRAIGRTGLVKGGREYDNNLQTPVFLSARNLQPFIPAELIQNAAPILFNSKGIRSIGYRADLLPQVCEVFLDAEDAGVLTPNQVHIARACKLLIRGFARVGIIALVDEATGYQETRDRLALQKILERYISQELVAWAKRFPDDFYEQLFRLRGWQWKGVSVKRPILVGKLTNDLVYQRLAPGVLEELQRLTPRDEKGRTKHRYHQRLTTDVGHPALEKHLHAVIALMRASTNWDGFYRLMQRSFPKLNSTLPLDLDFHDE